MMLLPQPLFCRRHSHLSLDLIAKVDNTVLSNRHSGAEQRGNGSFSVFMKSASVFYAVMTLPLRAYIKERNRKRKPEWEMDLFLRYTSKL